MNVSSAIFFSLMETLAFGMQEQMALKYPSSIGINVYFVFNESTDRTYRKFSQLLVNKHTQKPCSLLTINEI